MLDPTKILGRLGKKSWSGSNPRPFQAVQAQSQSEWTQVDGAGMRGLGLTLAPVSDWFVCTLSLGVSSHRRLCGICYLYPGKQAFVRAESVRASMMHAR